MKIRRLLISIAALVACICASAQTKDISFMAGLNVPLTQQYVPTGTTFSVNYSYIYRNGLGVRTGFQWSPDEAEIKDVFGVPVAFVYRTHKRNTQERMYSSVVGAMGSLVYDGTYREPDDVKGDMFSNFLINLFSDMEYFVGLTPGFSVNTSSEVSELEYGSPTRYREKSWTQRKNLFSLTADAGMCLNYSIWKFDIRLMPAFHYNIFDSMSYYEERNEVGSNISVVNGTPLRWFFTFTAGLAYKF